MTLRVPTEYGNREDRYRKALEKIRGFYYVESGNGRFCFTGINPQDIAREALAEPEWVCSFHELPEGQCGSCSVVKLKNTTQECDNRGNCALFPGPVCKNCEKPKSTQVYTIDREKLISWRNSQSKDNMWYEVLSNLLDCLVPLNKDV